MNLQFHAMKHDVLWYGIINLSRNLYQPNKISPFIIWGFAAKKQKTSRDLLKQKRAVTYSVSYTPVSLGEESYREKSKVFILVVNMLRALGLVLTVTGEFWVFFVRCGKYEDSRAGLGTMARSRKRTQPHIIILLADDLGWNEVSWNNQLFLTPNLQVRCEALHSVLTRGGRASN